MGSTGEFFPYCQMRSIRGQFARISEKSEIGWCKLIFSAINVSSRLPPPHLTNSEANWALAAKRKELRDYFVNTNPDEPSYSFSAASASSRAASNSSPLTQAGISSALAIAKPVQKPSNASAIMPSKFQLSSYSSVGW
jgi:hypothetical protein